MDEGCTLRCMETNHQEICFIVDLLNYERPHLPRDGPAGIARLHGRLLII
jgi:hypothetical protein